MPDRVAHPGGVRIFRQFAAVGVDLPESAELVQQRDDAGRMNDSSFKSWITSKRYGLTAGRHSPDRSGLPSGIRGTGAVRFGFPSAVRGMPGVGKFSHWARAATVNTMARVIVRIG